MFLELIPPMSVTVVIPMVYVVHLVTECSPSLANALAYRLRRDGEKS
jgi:hypothetical protein